MAKSPELTPEMISSTFVAHVRKERDKATPVIPVLFKEWKERMELFRELFPDDSVSDASPFRVGDWCSEDYHVDQFGGKHGDLGVVVPGAGARRVSRYNDIGLATPYEFIQETVQTAGGVVQVEYCAHENCGWLFEKGFITKESQLNEILAAGLAWQDAVQRMKRQSPADGKRVDLKIRVAPRGPAPVIENVCNYIRDKNAKFGVVRDERIRLVNPDYLNTIIYQYPLGPEIAERLVPEQRQELKQREERQQKILFQRDPIS